MFYKMLSSGQLKIVLSARDMTELGVDIESQSLNSPDVRIVFLSLLSSIEEDVPFPQNRSTLLIEVSPMKGGGCVAVYTAIVNAGQVVYPLTCYSFSDALTFYDAAISVFSAYSSSIYRSYGFYDGDSYYLAMTTLNEPEGVCRLLSEFGRPMESDSLTLPFMQEHFQGIPVENVLDRLYEADVEAHNETEKALPEALEVDAAYTIGQEPRS